MLSLQNFIVVKHNVTQMCTKELICNKTFKEKRKKEKKEEKKRKVYCIWFLFLPYMSLCCVYMYGSQSVNPKTSCRLMFETDMSLQYSGTCYVLQGDRWWIIYTVSNGTSKASYIYIPPPPTQNNNLFLLRVSVMRSIFHQGSIVFPITRYMCVDHIIIQAIGTGHSCNWESEANWAIRAVHLA